MKTFYLYITLFISLLTGFTACQEEEMPAVSPASGLYVSLTIGGEKPAGTPSSRATIAGEDALGENTIDVADFFLFNTERELVTYQAQNVNGHWTYTTQTTTYQTLFVGVDWINNQVIKSGYTLYAIANIPDSLRNKVTDWNSLLQLTMTDSLIYQKKTDGSKRFLMDGYYTFTEDDISQFNANKSGTHQLSIDVARAAAKIRVDLYKENNWPADNATLGTITTSVKNYASHTAVMTEATPPTDRKLRNIAHDASHKVETYQRTDINDPNYIGSVLFYTFANTWADSSDKETSLEVNIPYTGRENNYYKIVFLPEENSKELKRNTYYETKVTVKHDGADRSEESVTLEAQWKIAEWTQKDINIDRNNASDYLILSDYYLDLRNTTDAQIAFYSSNVIDTIEVIGFSTDGNKIQKPADDDNYTNETFATTMPGTFDYPGKVMPEEEYKNLLTGQSIDHIPGAFYVNKQNYRIDITQDRKGGNRTINTQSYSVKTNNSTTQRSPHEDEEIFITWPGNQSKQGVISIYSKIPQNVTKRYITLRVKMKKLFSDDGYITRYVVIEQYPLEYITFRPGLVSYMDANILGQNNKDSVKYIYDCPEKLWEYDDSDKKNIIWGNEIDLLSDKYEYGDSIIKYLKGHVPNNANMKSKFFLAEETWKDTEGTHFGEIFQIQDNYLTKVDKANNKGEFRPKNDDGNIGIVTNGTACNNSMYLVTITATSAKYTISYPMLTGTGPDICADTTAANNNLISPKFMIASQLGNNAAIAFWEVAYEQCRHYVEVGVDGTVYDDWRLPTKAELEIIKGYQQDEDVYDITMNKVLNSDGDTQPRYWTAQPGWYVETTGAGIAKKQGTDWSYEWSSNNYFSYDKERDKTAEDAKSVRVRCRCVRDVKE